MRAKVYQTLSTLVVNPSYQRNLRHKKELKQMRIEDLLCSLYGTITLLLVFFGALRADFWFGLQLMVSGIAFVNTYRATAAHRYALENKDEGHSFNEQLTDSISVPRGFFTFLWAPLNLNYHSLHHLLPGLPYKSLHEAHKILAAKLPNNHSYFKTIEPSLLSALQKLWQNCN